MSADEAHLHWNGTFCPDGRSRLAPGLPVRHTGELYAHLPLQARLAGPLNRHLWLDQKFYLADDILYKVDRMSMAHSLEVRPPFLDHRIVKFAAGLPEHFKVRSSKTKFVLRELLKGKVPASVLNRAKQGFDIPAHAWLRGDLRHLLYDTLNERDVRASGIFSWPEIDALISAHGNRRVNVGYHLWGLLTLFLWMKRWNIQTVSSEESRPWEMPVVGVSKSSSWLR